MDQRGIVIVVVTDKVELKEENANGQGKAQDEASSEGRIRRCTRIMMVAVSAVIDYSNHDDMIDCLPVGLSTVGTKQ